MSTPKFTPDQVARYGRQIILPGFGGKAQRRLLESRVLVVGAGGLGSPALYYLAAAGVGHLHIVDDDTVDLSNLHRQILHRTEDVGRAKAESARQTIGALNPDVQVHTHTERLTVANAAELIGGVDLVIEGSDNFPTRYLVNDACYFARKPLVNGALFRYEGQATVFPMRREGTAPCYRCLFPEMPGPGLIPTCAEAGILGAVAGVIGTLQAAEAIKLLLGQGESLAGRLLIYDAFTADFREIKIERDPQCPLCGVAPCITELRSEEPSG